MASIYNIDNWDDDGKDYGLYDIVKYGSPVSNFFYCKKAHESADTPTKIPGWPSEYWDGIVNIVHAGSTKTWPFFWWSPAYNVQTSHQPRIISIQLGDGYEQRMPDGLNHDRLEFQLNFDKRKGEEATSIIHFLAARQGYQSFYFRAPAPYGVTKKFICKTWNSTLIFDDNYTITATFTEKS